MTIQVVDACTVYTVNFNYCTCLIDYNISPSNHKGRTTYCFCLQVSNWPLVLPLSPWHQLIFRLLLCAKSVPHLIPLIFITTHQRWRNWASESLSPLPKAFCHLRNRARSEASCVQRSTRGLCDLNWVELKPWSDLCQGHNLTRGRA